jgi:hypothetical protein
VGHRIDDVVHTDRRAPGGVLDREARIIRGVNPKRSGDILGRMWKTLVLGIFAVVLTHDTYSQVPCPVSLTSAHAEQDNIKLEFVNKGKLPIEQLSLSCMPSANNKSGSAICHNETGIFYPGTEYWIEIAYLGANRHSIAISVNEVRLAGGVSWNTRSSDSCLTLRVSGKR